MSESSTAEPQFNLGRELFIDFVWRRKWAMLAICVYACCTFSTVFMHPPYGLVATAWVHGMVVGSMVFLHVWTDHRSGWGRVVKALPVPSDTLARLCWFQYAVFCSAVMANPGVWIAMYLGAGWGGVAAVSMTTVAILGSICFFLTCSAELKSQTLLRLGRLGLLRVVVCAAVAVGVAACLLLSPPLLWGDLRGFRCVFVLLGLSFAWWSYARRTFLTQRTAFARTGIAAPRQSSRMVLTYSSTGWSRWRFHIQYAAVCFLAGALWSALLFWMSRDLPSGIRTQKNAAGVTIDVLIIISMALASGHELPLRAHRFLPLSGGRLFLRFASYRLFGYAALLAGAWPVLSYGPHPYASAASVWVFCSGVGIVLTLGKMVLSRIPFITLVFAGGVILFQFLSAAIEGLEPLCLGVTGAPLLAGGLWCLYVVIAYKSQPYRLETMREAEKRT